jgi:hypothetical protein
MTASIAGAAIAGLININDAIALRGIVAVWREWSEAMNAGWKIVLLSLAVFAIAFGAERLLVPDVVPIGFAEESQPLLSVQTAFVLRSIELIAGSVAAISLVITLGAWVKRRVGGPAQSLGAGTSIPSAE